MVQPIIARDLPDLRHSVDVVVGGYLPLILQIDLEINPYSVVVPEAMEGLPTTEIAMRLAAAERARLRAAELYFVNKEMSELAIHAGASMPRFSLDAEDLPSPSGLLVWDRPIGMSDGGDYPVTAISWGPYGDGVWLSYYCDRGEGLDPEATFPDPDPARWPGEGSLAHQRRLQQERAEVQAQRSAVRMQNRSRLAYEREQIVPFGQNFAWLSDELAGRAPEGATVVINANPADPVAGGELVEPMLRTVLATWLLMGQRVASTQELQVDRGTRRRLARTFTPASAVRVTTLRRPARMPEGGEDQVVTDGGRVYTCRWVVSGHWRNVWFPSKEQHKPRWFDETVATPKGGEGLPLKGRDRVKVLRR